MQAPIVVLQSKRYGLHYGYNKEQRYKRKTNLTSLRNSLSYCTAAENSRTKTNYAKFPIWNNHTAPVSEYLLFYLGTKRVHTKNGGHFP